MNRYINNDIEISVQPYKFLFNYKIFILFIIISIFSYILLKKQYKKFAIVQMISNLLTLIGYIIYRIIETKKNGYFYFVETNNSFECISNYMIINLLCICIFFLFIKIIDFIKNKLK